MKTKPHTIQTFALLLICGAFFNLFQPVVAGDAVYWDTTAGTNSIHFYNSTTPEGGANYKNSSEASAAVLKLAKASGYEKPAIVWDSDRAGYFCVAVGYVDSQILTIDVEPGTSQAEADRKALAGLAQIGATHNQKVLYRYHS